MKVLNHVCYALLLAGITSCGASAERKADEQTVEQAAITDDAQQDNTQYTELISSVYGKFVFAIDSDGNAAPEIYFTANALQKLQDDNEYDSDEGPCYAYYALRTENQDSNPDTDGSSFIISIEPAEDGWYTVSYSDMGWNGKTRVKISDGKIDDYKRLK